MTAMRVDETRKLRLEEMIDGSSVKEVLDMIGTICSEKGDHIRGNWQDEPMARRWERVGQRCDKLSESIDL